MTTTSNVNALQRALALHQMSIELLELRDYLRECKAEAETYRYQENYRKLMENRRTAVERKQAWKRN